MRLDGRAYDAGVHRLRPSYLVAAAWALWQTGQAKRVVRHGVPAPGAIGRPPRAAGNDRRAVLSVLHRTRSTCLVRSLVLQAWEAAHGVERDIVIGVTGRADFQAHAWLDGEPGEPTERFTEMVRLGAR